MDYCSFDTIGDFGWVPGPWTGVCGTCFVKLLPDVRGSLFWDAKLLCSFGEGLASLDSSNKAIFLWRIMMGTSRHCNISKATENEQNI
jgi:hypothetical protein